ncbi:MFS transporter [Actinospica robiniae]|uniref:MFS transporter n=1 Tax=Actinospica robiniae TaxID=304901 RepID=UPI001FDF846A|nr:MFS transporter [Actinospica robiniae]
MAVADAAAQPGTGADRPDRYKWVALSNTTLGMFMATVDASIVIISLPAIFRGIHLDPFAPGNIGYLLWIIMGYLLVTAVLVVTLGRLGDIVGRVRIYNLGFVVFTLSSVALSLDPADGSAGALWLIGWRLVQAVGGAMLMANSAAIITDAFPAEQRGMALGVNQISALAGQFIGLVLGGVLSVWDWHAIFWINVPFGAFGTIWAYRSLRELSQRRPARIDWWGNLTFAVGLATVLAAITYGIQPYQNHSMGWTNPRVFGSLILGVALLLVFGFIETRVPQPMFRLSLFRNRAFAAGNAAALLASIARGGMQFMLIIWLQGIWLPLHGYDYADTPLWAGIFLLPLTAGFLLAGPLCGYLSDRYGVFLFTTGGLTLFAGSFIGLLFLPLNFSYWAFALLIMLNGFGSGMFSAPNTSAIMSSVPAEHRGAASGMRSTFQNAGMSLSIGVFFSLLITGLAGRLPGALSAGLVGQGVSPAAAHQAAQLPAVSTVFTAFLGANPMQTLLGPSGVLDSLSPHAAQLITGKQFFPNLISAPFHHGLTIVFATAAGMALLAATASLLRGTTPPGPGARVSERAKAPEKAAR